MRIAWEEKELRERARRLGAVWRPAQKAWEIYWRDAKRLGISDRVCAEPRCARHLARDIKPVYVKKFLELVEGA